MNRPAAMARRQLAGHDAVVDRLDELIDLPRLCRLGWDPTREVFTPAADDVVFGFIECATAGCERIGAGGTGLCRSCAVRQRRSTTTSVDELTQRRSTSVRGDGLCVLCCTPGHERPARSRGLCRACWSVIGQRGQSVAAYLDGDDEFPPATPRPSFGTCQVTACARWAHRGEPALCEWHERAWRDAGRLTGASFEVWRRRQASGVDGGSRMAVLRGLGRRVQLELLYGLQCAAEAEQRTPIESVQRAAQLLRTHDATSITDLPGEYFRRLPLLAFARDRVNLARTDPATEAAGDDWDLRVFGRPRGRLHFGRISQPWLKEATKWWAFERLSTLEHAAQRPNVVERVVHCVGMLSESLRRHRSDRGADPALLSRADALAFCADLTNMETAGRFSRTTHGIWLAGVEQFLREARDMGLTRPGRPLAGLAEDMAVHRSDRIPRRSSDDEEGRALPPMVIDQLLDPAALQLLEDIAGADVRTMVELQARVGRRTAELCQLRWECLSFDEIIDETGQPRPAPVLIHDMPKIAVRRYHLPIDDDTAEIIRTQQARTKARHPDTATSQLALFPAPLHNPHGVKARLTASFRDSLRSWLAALPALIGPGGEPYDRSTITPYSFRHSYAQRHADAGTPVEVLAALMGHQRLTTTQGYYRVTQKRKRKAVDVLAALQLDRAGARQRPTVERLLDAEHLRDAVGQVAVPFGVCREPTNVKAHGHACPFRHQCFGCTHFRSDPSFLPELRGYLSRLLADRERLRTAVPELEDWARNAAIPSGEEVAAVRRIIDRCEELLADLTEDQRAETEQAITVLRRSRAQLDTSVPVRFLGVIGQPSPTLFPNVRREQSQR